MHGATQIRYEKPSERSTVANLANMIIGQTGGIESSLILYQDRGGSDTIYYTDPSGTFWQCNAKAIGSGSEGADSSLQEQFNKDLSLKEAEKIALSILKQVMEEKVTPNNVDIARVSPTYHLYSPSEVEDVISRL
ncbi:Proteasome subunit alpha type-5 [Capsicum chinense]|nr:Proteasome subunit alpha type-5 [Capsicum chinense]